MLKNLPLSKILLSLAAVSVVAVAAVGGTFANFTATPTSIASNAFASGSLSMTRSGSRSTTARWADSAQRRSERLQQAVKPFRLGKLEAAIVSALAA